MNQLNYVNFKKDYSGNIRIVKGAVTENGLQNPVYYFKPDYTLQYRGADKSLAWPGGKQATATENSDVHISYL